MMNCIPQELVAQLKEKALKGKITPEDIAKMLPTEKVALRSILQDFVAEKLGVKVTNEEVKIIQEKAKKIDVAQEKLGNELGNPLKEQDNIDFFIAKKEMDNYLESRNPSNVIKVTTGTIGRGMMLASVKSPILNIGSNIEVGFTEALARRISEGRLRGTDNKLAVDFVKMTNKIYQKTGYDISRMMTIKDTGTSGARVLGTRVHTQGPGKIRAVGRIVEDVVFKQLMGAPDVAFSSAHFADSVNLSSLKMAKGDRVRAREIMVDSMKLEPQTAEGKIIREQGILDAQVATWTNTSWASKLSESIRKVLDDVSGDVQLGKYLLPFIKTPANVIATGMDYAGMGIPKALIKTIRAVRTGELGSKAYLQGVSRDLVRSGIGLVGAVVIASQLSEDDFMGAYDPQRAQIEVLRNSNTNALRFNGKWISTDWLGPLAIPVTAMMYSRKYGKTGKGERVFQYGKGVLSTALNIPGVSDIRDTVVSGAYKKNQTLNEMTGEAVDYLTSQLWSRLVPGVVSDFAKAVDPYARQGGKGFAGIKAKTPFLSKTLPIKTDIFGQQIKGESAVTDLIFGARVRTSKDTELIKELSRVSSATDKGITFTNWALSSSKTLAQLKAKVGGVRYDEAKVKYGQELKKQLELTVNKPAYKKLSDEDKLSVLNGKDSEVMTKIFNMYGFHYESTPSNIPKGL